MKRSLIIIVLSSCLIAGGVFSYLHWKQSNLSIWSFVPTNSILVFQPNNFAELWNESQEKKIFQNLKSTPELDSLQRNYQSLDSLTHGQLEQYFDGQNLLISFHKSTSEALSALFLLEISQLNQHDIFSQIFSYLTDSLSYQKSERKYQGYVITEFSKEEDILAYIYHKNYLIASFSPVLVEDAIRMIDNDKINAFLQQEHLSVNASQEMDGMGRFYFNTSLLDKFAGIFVNQVDLDTTPMKWLTHLMYLDLSIDNDKMDLSGFSVNDTASINYLSAFDGIRGVGFEMKNVIPASTSFVIHSSVDDITQWHKGLKNYWRKHNPPQLTKIGELENRYDFDIETFYQFMSDEVGFFILSNNAREQQEQIFCIKHANEDQASNFFFGLSHASAADTSWYQETYAGRNIGKIEIDDIPSRIFGVLYQGFPTSYFFVDQNYVYIGSSQNALETLIDDIDSENTWRKSVKTNDFLETTNDDANFSIYFKNGGALDLVEHKLNDFWANYLNDYKNIFSQIEYGAVQFTNVDNSYYTNITLEHPGELVEQINPSSINTESELAFSNALVSKPFGIRNHNDRSLEMVVQDEANSLHLISAKNEKLLEIKIEGPLSSNIYQIDYYKNGKLQFLFALDHSIHMIDRTGTYIPGYPVKFKSKNKLSELSLIDYDQSKNYRILAIDEKGDHYLYNKAGKLLEGWNPKKLDGEPATAGVHQRVKSSDFILSLQKNGIFQALNRKGDTRTGFPIDLKGNTSSGFMVDKGGNLSSSTISCLTDLGELVTFNFEGKINDRQQLYRENEEVQFQLVRSNDGKEFVIAAMSLIDIKIYDQNLEELFSLPKSSEKVLFQYYSFGADNQLIIVVDQESQLGYLYNKEGRMLHKEPIRAGFELAVLFQEGKNQYRLYCTYDNQMNVISINR